MQTSEKGRQFIQGWEGFSAVPYLCSGGVWTNGYGHTKGVTAHTPAITKAEADALFAIDLKRFELSVMRLITASLNQNQFDALVSFVYNLGGGALQRSTLRSKLNRGDYADAADEFLKWVRAGGKMSRGLWRRREAERALFLAGESKRNTPIEQWTANARNKPTLVI